jgi:uncharacterized membrane protein
MRAWSLAWILEWLITAAVIASLAAMLARVFGWPWGPTILGGSGMAVVVFVLLVLLDYRRMVREVRRHNERIDAAIERHRAEWKKAPRRRRGGGGWGR